MNERKMFANRRRQLKSGSYILVLTVIVLAVVIVLNAVVAALPASSTEIDVSEKQIYTIGDTTKEFVDKLSTDVEIFYLVEDGNEDKYVAQMLASYDELSDHIVYKTVDPAVEPNFAYKYTEDEVESGSVIFTSDKRSTVVGYSETYKYYSETYGVVPDGYLSEYSSGQFYNYYTFPQYLEMYYGISDVTLRFYGEQLFTSAIDYVTTDSIPSVYEVTGHGETSLGSAYKEFISLENFELEQLSLINSDIPDDAEGLILNLPGHDLEKDEADKITEYVKNGGYIIVVTSGSVYSEEKYPNLASVLSTFGMKAEEGTVTERDMDFVPSGAAQQDRYDVFNAQYGDPVDFSPVSKMVSLNYGFYVEQAHGIVQTDAENVEFADVLHTTEQGVLINGDGAESDDTGSADTSDAQSAENESPDGSDESDAKKRGITVAAASRYNGSGRVVWFASGSLTNEAYLNMGYGHLVVFSATLNLMTGRTESFSIIGKELAGETFTPSASTRTAWTVVLCVIVPVAVLGTGLGVWIYRRRR